MTPPEVWSTYDPDKGALDEEIIRQWSEKGATYKEVYFSAYVNGHTVRVYGLYAAPEGATGVAAVMHLHGGGQTVSKPWLETWTARGYACLSCNYHGVWDNRDRYTLYPEALKQGNHKHNRGKAMATDPTVRESSWYIWTAVARRALSYLREQPGVDKSRIGAFGVSMGGTTMWSFAMDPRLKAACAIYGCGWNRFHRRIPRFAKRPSQARLKEVDKVWLGGMAPEAYPPYLTCPMLFLSATNDHHGKMDRAYQTLDRVKEGTQWRIGLTARQRHHIGSGFDKTLLAWMDCWLKEEGKLPETPKASIELNGAGVPTLTVAPDRPGDVKAIHVYYAVDNPDVVSRNWRDGRAKTTDGEVKALLPVMDVSQRLFAIANVRYQDGVVLTSQLATAIPRDLGDARATDTHSLVIYDGSEGTGMWTTSSPGTDPIPGSIRTVLKTSVGPDGRKGFTVGARFSPLTHQLGDPKWRGPKGAKLALDIATSRDQTLVVAIHGKQREYRKAVTLKGKPGWQTVVVSLGELSEVRNGLPLKSWNSVTTLELTRPDKATWADEGIRFTHVRWIVE
ncbi:MAG: dienelactone hydrolase family protein [Candidatus Brocadiae bacterium]|nr:dienelactone hydrolase family protein [Candidatus Brocadiia bacterium]